MNKCPLCNSFVNNILAGPDERKYYFCQTCNLIFVDKSYHPSAQAEKSRYLKHKNNITQTGYIEFLNQAIKPAIQFIKINMCGLDYGCGHTPVLSVLIKQRGFICDDYDPLFFPLLEKEKLYDFIFATECFEHFFNPHYDLEKLASLMNKEAYLIVTTEQWKTFDEFKNWSYARDFTHVSFYCKNNFDWIAVNFGLIKVFDDNERVVIFKRIKK